MQSAEDLTLGQLWKRFEGRLQYDWELYGPIQLRILNLLNDKRPVELHDISPYHSVMERLRELEVTRAALETNTANIKGGTFEGLKAAIRKATDGESR